MQNFKDNNMDSFRLSPENSRRSLLDDNTFIDEPTCKNWWKRLNDTTIEDIMEVLENDKQEEAYNVIEEYMEDFRQTEQSSRKVEKKSQEKQTHTLDLPDSSDDESISSIIVPPRKLFPQKERQRKSKFAQLLGTRDSMAPLNTTNKSEKTIVGGTKKFFDQSPDKTINKTTEEIKGQVRNLFSNRAGRVNWKNNFAFIASESEDEPEIQPKVLGFRSADNRAGGMERKNNFSGFVTLESEDLHEEDEQNESQEVENDVLVETEEDDELEQNEEIDEQNESQEIVYGVGDESEVEEENDGEEVIDKRVCEQHESNEVLDESVDDNEVNSDESDNNISQEDISGTEEGTLNITHATKVGAKKKNNLAGFITLESEDEPEIQPKVFGFRSAGNRAGGMKRKNNFSVFITLESKDLHEEDEQNESQEVENYVLVETEEDDELEQNEEIDEQNESQEIVYGVGDESEVEEENDGEEVIDKSACEQHESNDVLDESVDDNEVNGDESDEMESFTANNRLYKYLENKLEAKYDYKARFLAEILVKTVYTFTTEVREHTVAPSDAVESLKHVLARLEIVRTHLDFYHFCHQYLPREVQLKVNPDGINNIPLPRDGIFADILGGSTSQD